MSRLPDPSPDAKAFSNALSQHIAESIAQAGGWIGFDQFMSLALYTPGKGYYAGGAQKFGATGDFVTAPEISPLFAESLAAQVAQILELSAPHILEFGAGSGRLAADLLLELEARSSLPDRYTIIDLSGELRVRQKETIERLAPHLVDRVVWLDALPDRFDGLILANELLDAMPVHLVLWQEQDNAIFERGVTVKNDAFSWDDRAASGRLLESAKALSNEFSLSQGYLSEVNLAATDWVSTIARVLGKGALLLIDYGFPSFEYYHPQRSEGTLMCHYQHQAHIDPFFFPGLQDITAHVDFTAVAEAGFDAGLDVLGYATQSGFLVDCGLIKLFQRFDSSDPIKHLPQAQAVQKLISPAEMGELFKVIALGKGIESSLLGFASSDRRARL